MHKIDPDDKDLSDVVEKLKLRHADKKREMLGSKTLEEQLHGTHERLRRLKDEVESFTSKMREASLEEEAAAKKADTFYQTILSHNEEMGRLRTETRSLQNSLVQPVSRACDMAQAVERLRGGYQEHFGDASLPAEIASKRGEIEQAFTQLSTILQGLSNFDVILQSARSGTAPQQPPQQQQQQQQLLSQQQQLQQQQQQQHQQEPQQPSPPSSLQQQAASTAILPFVAVPVAGEIVETVVSPQGTAASSSMVTDVENNVENAPVVSVDDRSSGQKSIRDLTTDELMEHRAGRRKIANNNNNNNNTFDALSDHLSVEA